MTAPDVAGAELLYTPAAVEEAADGMGAAITRRLAGREYVAICLLQGGIVPTGLLLPRIAAPLALDSVDITRYRNATEGGAVDWRAGPRELPLDRRVLLIDDILDEGHSLAAVRARLLEAGATEVLIAVLVAKRRRDHTPRVNADFVGLEVPDRYVFGYGMDYLGWHRNAAGIFALPE